MYAKENVVNDNTMITYAHTADPDGVRFQQFVKDPIPKWAIDVQPYFITETDKQVAILDNPFIRIKGQYIYKRNQNSYKMAVK